MTADRRAPGPQAAAACFAVAAALLLQPGVTGAAEAPSTFESGQTRGPGWIDVHDIARRLQPREVDGARVWEYELVVTETELRLVDGTRYKVWAFGGTVPGPPILAREGDRVRIRLVNETSVPHTIHSHGLHVPVRMDGVAHAHAGHETSAMPSWAHPVAPGEVFTYEYVARPAGTHFYHCHMNTNEHLDRGMSGPLIVLPRDPEPAVDRDVVLLLDEWDRSYAQEGVPGAPGDLAGYDVFTLNGRSHPETETLPLELGDVARVRLVNTGSLPHYMHLHGHSFLVTHRDGGRLEAPIVLDTVEVGPGQRVDILIAANNPGLWPFHCHSPPHVTNAGAYPGGMLTRIQVGSDPFPSEGDGPVGPGLEEIGRAWGAGSGEPRP